MANDLIGRFYFKKTSNGNLIGEFSNNQKNSRISTESSDLVKSENANRNYIGTYNSTWQENGKPLFADLTISPKIGNNELFTLSWSRNGKPIFKGEGMLCDDILIGDYQNV
jgi:hypothetical protein